MSLRMIGDSNQLGEWKHVRGDINWNFKEISNRHGAFAYLITPTTTTITTHDVYYPISGVFANGPIYSFELVAAPGIKYTCSEPHYFQIFWNAALKCNVNGTTVHCGIKRNSELLTGSIMCSYCKYAAEIYNLSGTVVTELSTNDVIQLVVTSDGDSDIITFEHYTTTINQFFTV